MKYFEFSNNVIPKVLDEIRRANKFIKIAVFQIHLKDLFDLLEQKANEGVEVDILTLPFDSINEDIRETVEARLKRLSETGVKLHFCRWNVGNPYNTPQNSDQYIRCEVVV